MQIVVAIPQFHRPIGHWLHDGDSIAPVADPAYLQKVVDAMGQVRAGKVKPIAQNGKHEYVFEGFSFLMK